MKAIPLKIKDAGYVRCDPKEVTHLLLKLPGPIATRIIPVMIGGTRAGTNNWTWNGSIDSPTVKPSVLSKSGDHVCHSWINDGKVKFLSDCTHELAGQTLDLLDTDDIPL